MNNLRIVIHCGRLSLDNGAKFPLNQYFDLASILNVEPIVGEYYGDDQIEIRQDQWPIAKDLIIESNLLYKIKGIDADWKNIKTTEVSKRLGIVCPANS